MKQGNARLHSDHGIRGPIGLAVILMAAFIVAIAIMGPRERTTVADNSFLTPPITQPARP